VLLQRWLEEAGDDERKEEQLSALRGFRISLPSWVLWAHHKVERDAEALLLRCTKDTFDEATLQRHLMIKIGKSQARWSDPHSSAQMTRYL